MQRRVIAFVLALAVAAGMLGARATYASPQDGTVDLWNKPVHLQGSYVNPYSGSTSNLTLPLDALPPQVREMFNTPVGVALNNAWSSAAPQLCQAAASQLNGLGEGSFHVYDTECGFAPVGRATATQQGDKVIISYFLPQNFITAYVTTPVTCAPGHGTFLCPTDPKISLTADVILQATIETPGLVCSARVDPFSVSVANVTLDSQNLTADIAFDAADLWALITGTDYVSMAQNLFAQSVQQQNASAALTQQSVLGKANTFFRTLCTTIIPSLPGANDLWTLNASVDSNQGIVFQVTDAPPSPGFRVPASLTVSPAAVNAGSSVRVSGDSFHTDGAVALTLAGPGGSVHLGDATITGHTFSTTVTIPAGTASGSYTVHAAASGETADAALQVAAAHGDTALTVTLNGAVLSGSYLTIDWNSSGYALLGTNFQPGPISLYISASDAFGDGSKLLFSTVVGADGTFSHEVQVAGNQVGFSAGYYNLQAVQGGALVNETTVRVQGPPVIN